MRANKRIRDTHPSRNSTPRSMGIVASTAAELGQETADVDMSSRRKRACCGAICVAVLALRGEVSGEPSPCETVFISPVSVSPDSIVSGCGSVQIEHCINLDARETIWIQDANGDPVDFLLDGVDRAAGCWTDEWNGLEDDGNPAAPGAYTVVIESIHLDASHPMVPFGPTGQGEGEVGVVHGLAYDGNLVYALTRAWGVNKIVRYDKDNGTYVPTEYVLPDYVPPGPGPCETSPYIQGMARDPQGRLYIRDGQPLPRITVWDASTWPPNCVCPNLGYGEMYSTGQEVNPIAYDHFADRILTWARYNPGDDRVFAFDSPCGLQPCTPPIDPTPGANEALWASGLALDGLSNIWLAAASATYVFDQPCGSQFNVWDDTFNSPISVRYGRLVYYKYGGTIQVKDLRLNHLQGFCVDWIPGDPSHIVTPEGPYIYATGHGPCPSSDQFQCVRIQDCNSAALGTAEIVVTPGKCEPIPTVSEWGVVVMVLLLVTAGTIVFRIRQTAAV